MPTARLPVRLRARARSAATSPQRSPAGHSRCAFVATRCSPLDIDTPADLAHPLVEEVLPAWLPTNPANPAVTTGMRSRRNLAVPASALAIGAHPDDVEFGGGATLAKWAAAGCVVHHLVCTDGSKGTWDADADIARARRRLARHEQREAARRSPAATPARCVFLGRVDGELDSDLATRGEVAACDPRGCARGRAGPRPVEALPAAPRPSPRRPAGVRRHRRGPRPALLPRAAARPPPAATLLLWEADVPDHVEDVSGCVDAKLDACLEAHASQFETTMKAVDDAQLEAFRKRIRDRLAELGAPYGSGAAEVFKLITESVRSTSSGLAN